jgi:ribonuclease VapC
MKPKLPNLENGVARVVLDSSAILAVIFEEKGQEAVLQYMIKAVASANIIAEVFTKMIDNGSTVTEATETITSFEFDIHAVDAEAALAIGEMRAATRSAGLSLGDRSCLALARKLGVPVVTADREWQTVAAAIGVEVILIR